MICPLCDSDRLQLIYQAKSIPVFQNKVYPSQEAAKRAAVGNVSLMACENCSYVFNSSFDPGVMNYNEQYKNEQTVSPYFDNHLNDIVQMLEARRFKDKKIQEIGCGKGTFLEKLWKRGFDATGFDPAYEGNDRRIVKDYFSNKYSNIETDLIIIRHTLEHIHYPLEFLHDIAKATNRHGTIFIETPSFEWIAEKRAFWDIFYEHCNYFTSETLKNIFDDAEQGFLFNNQYLFVLADLRGLRLKAKRASVLIEKDQCKFNDKFYEYKQFVHNHPNLIIWGAGAKGSTFVNLSDPLVRYIYLVIDINPKKHNQFIARTGHPVVAPDILHGLSSGDILIMNENYYDEIRAEYDNGRFHFHVL